MSDDGHAGWGERKHDDGDHRSGDRSDGRARPAELRCEES